MPRDLSAAVDGRQNAHPVASEIVEQDRILRFRTDQAHAVFRIAHKAVPCEHVFDLLIRLDAVDLVQKCVDLLAHVIGILVFVRIRRTFVEVEIRTADRNQIVLAALFVFIWPTSEVIVRILDADISNQCSS